MKKSSFEAVSASKKEWNGAEVPRETVPVEVSRVTETLEKAGFKAYLIGGCTRDLILGHKPKDWDVTTDAVPDEIIKLFPKTFYENNYGTVGVVDEAATDETLKVVEVTPFRLEGGYSDFRRPDSVSFSKSLEDDVKRRDFTVNAIGMTLTAEGIEVTDLCGGIKDIKDKVLRTVGEPDARFGEDALRILRAVRLGAQLGFAIEEKTFAAMVKNADLLAKIAKERIREEFSRMLMTDRPMEALEMCRKLGILKYIAPELEEGVGIEQNQAHSFDVWEHLMRTLNHAAAKGWALDIRLAALFHDVGKPRTRRRDETKDEWTFYGHEVVGAKMTKKILEDLKYPKAITEKVVKLVRWHMFFSDTEQITLSAVRRMVANVGPENIWELMNVRICDRIGTGRPKEDPYRLRKYKAMVEEALRDPISVGMLKIDGSRIMEISHETPGPKIGFTLLALLEEVLEDPKLNTAEYLETKAVELMKLPVQDLKALGEKGKEKLEEEEGKELKALRRKHSV
jgi:poly(A) polymerase/tRNA nucleotidyltransferase (CCA-adding enzyme)